MKKITTLLFVLFISSGSYAQFNLYWDNIFQYTGSNNYSHEARKVATDANGNIFVLSDITSDFDTLMHPAPQTQFYVVLQKYSASGNLLAQKLINAVNMPLSNGFDYSSAFALEVDASGSVYIGFNKYNTVGSNYDVQVMKFNSTLTTAWTFKFATSANETGVNIVLRGTASYLLFKSVSGANTTYSIVRCEPNFTNTIPMYSFDTNVDVVNSICTTPSLNLFVTGYRIISGVKNVMTASVNPSGLLKWKSTFNNLTIGGDDFGNKVIVGSDGFVYITGTSFVNATNGNDAIVLRYNAANGTRNAQVFLNYSQGNGINDAGIDIAQGTTGVIFMASTKGSSDVVVSKINTVNGVTINSTASYKPQPLSYTSLTSLTIGGMKVAASNNVYICGTVSGASSAGNFSASYLVKYGLSSSVFSVLGNAGVEGDFTANLKGVGIALDAARNNLSFIRSYFKTNTTHTIESIRLNEYSLGSLRMGSELEATSSLDQELIVYPNPASDIVYFMSSENPEQVQLFDLSGKLVLSQETVSSSLDIAMLHPGMYILRVITRSGTSTQRLQIK